jgi:hypothetical protein
MEEREQLKGLTEKQGKMEIEVAEVKKTMEQVKEGAVSQDFEEVKKEVVKLRLDGEDMSKKWSDILKEKSEENKDRVIPVRSLAENREIQVKVTEAMEREKRRNNLVILGMKETDNDEYKDDVEELIKELMGGLYVKIQVGERIGRKDGKARPVRITVEDLRHRRNILRKAKELKNMEGKERIYITPDLTRLQQEDDKKLRDQVKIFRNRGDIDAKIVRGEVVKGEGNDRQVLFKLNN